MINKIIFLLQKYISIGADENTSINDLKKIQLLNIFCNTWHVYTLLSLIEGILENDIKLHSYILMFLLSFSCQVVIYFKKITAAGILMVMNTLFFAAYFSNYIYTQELLEYYLMLPPLILLIFVDNKFFNGSVLIVSLILLLVPNLYLHHYPISVLNNRNPPFLFLSTYAVIMFFKNLNIRNEKILEAKTKELEELDRFKSQFFTNISHEIRTPLTLINGQISNLVALNSREEEKQIQQNITKQIQKITNMVDSVLDLAKMQSSNFNIHLKSTNISNYIRRLYLNFEPLFTQKNIDFVFNTGSKDHFAEVDMVFFDKALSNLLVNAVKYTDKGRVEINLKAHKSRLIIKVMDTGIGIEEHNQENVFNRFYQVNNDINKSGGSGIGLAFTKEIIELHKGKINLKSIPNVGSEFTVTLPLEKSVLKNNEVENLEEKVEHKNSEDLDTKTELNINSNHNFLIVDDNTEMRTYLHSILKNYNCFEAENGLEALQLIKEEKIDFIITDYMMPKLNGHELIVALKANNYTMPVIMLTAKTDMDTKMDVLKLGVDDYITKPFNKEELLVRIDNCFKNYSSKKTFNEQNDINETTISNDPFLDKLTDYILENSNNSSLNQDDIAEAFVISKSSLYRKIKSTTGMTPNSFIKEIRLKKAHEIIVNGPKISLKELSFEVGFSHTSYFSKVYKERFGIKPMDEIKNRTN